VRSNASRRGIATVLGVSRARTGAMARALDTRSAAIAAIISTTAPAANARPAIAPRNANEAAEAASNATTAAGKILTSGCHRASPARRSAISSAFSLSSTWKKRRGPNGRARGASKMYPPCAGTKAASAM